MTGGATKASEVISTACDAVRFLGKREEFIGLSGVTGSEADEVSGDVEAVLRGE